MSKPIRLVTAASLLALTVSIAHGQRPRPASQDSPAASTSMPAPPAAPQTVKAKYEGGVFGYNKRVDGTLNFDDANGRLLFRDGKGKETGIFVPYKSITGAFGDTHRVQPAAATVASHIPSIFALPAHFIKTKVRYLTIQYNDPDSKVAGVTSFKLENKDILDSVLYTLAGKAELDRRGEVFVKKKTP